jgi:hypothetical protein
LYVKTLDWIGLVVGSRFPVKPSAEQRVQECLGLATLAGGVNEDPWS